MSEKSLIRESSSDSPNKLANQQGDAKGLDVIGKFDDYKRIKNIKDFQAAVAELADAQASGACVRKDVEVRILSAAGV